MPYRDDGAWIARRESLVRALVIETDLDLREKIGDELEEFDRQRRDEARRRLPVIAKASIASPCHETFEAMHGEGAVRACARCEQHVFDLARMTLAQAEALIASRGGGACVRLHRRADGTMMFADCEIGARAVRRTRIAALTMPTIAIAIAAAACVAHWPALGGVRRSHAHTAPSVGTGVRFVPAQRPPPDFFPCGIAGPPCGPYGPAVAS